MRRTLLLFALFISGNLTALHAQIPLRGTVTDRAGKPLKGASVYLENTLDGGTSDSTGHFSFTTTEKGFQTLSATRAGYEPGGTPLQTDTISPNTTFVIRLKKSATDLEEVTITAGSFDAGSSSKTILKPLDIITTAGANADVVKAIQTLPGTQQQGNQTGLFVRGGDASEAAVIVDGLTVQNAFFSSAPGVAARSRFMPWNLKGVSFSSGGYSARYGQALSSVLELNTLDMPEKSTVNLGANMAGVYVSGSKLWDSTFSVEGGASYTNLEPFYKLAQTNFDFYDVPKGGSGNATLTWRPRKGGLLKAMGNFTQFRSGTEVPNPDSPAQGLRFGIQNRNAYGTLSYRQLIGTKWNLYGAALYADNKDEIDQNGVPASAADRRTQGRLEATRYFGRRFTLLGGGEANLIRYERSYCTLPQSAFDETLLAAYTEATWTPLHWLSVKPGLRFENSSLLKEAVLSPRLSAAFKTGRRSTVSLAGGLFYQNPDPSLLLYGYRPNPARATHAIINYQWMTDTRTLRVEAYYKKYDDLARESATFYDPNPFHYPIGPVLATGDGYAQGLELFWRDRKTVKNLDYWVSYSYIDTRRQYRNYLAKAQPDFIATHNLNLIGKYWINKWSSQINISYNYASGRPYYNPHNPEFLGDRTPDFHNLSLTFNKLFSIGKWFTVAYAGVDNLTNRKNVFGYRYRSASDTQPLPQYPALFRSFFVGINLSRTEFSKDEI